MQAYSHETLFLIRDRGGPTAEVGPGAVGRDAQHSTQEEKSQNGRANRRFRWLFAKQAYSDGRPGHVHFQVFDDLCPELKM